MDVVHALDASKALKTDLITAATIQGEVTLSGTVSSGASSELAEAIAAHVAGVTKVNNNLQVGNPQAPAKPDAQPMADNQPGDAGAPAMNDGSMPVPNESEAQALIRAQIRAEIQAQIQAQREGQQQTPKAPVTLAQGTLLQLRTNEPVNSKRAKEDEPVQFTVIQDVFIGNVLAIPRGATAHGVVTEVKQAGDLKGSPVLGLKLTSLDMGGENYPVDSDQFKVKGPGKGGWTANNIVGGAMMGTIIGCIAGRGIGCAIGAGAGAAAGTAASAATPGPGVWIPAEARVDFHLSTPLTVTPVSAQEAARTAPTANRMPTTAIRRSTTVRTMRLAGTTTGVNHLRWGRRRLRAMRFVVSQPPAVGQTPSASVPFVSAGIPEAGMPALLSGRALVRFPVVYNGRESRRATIAHSA
jgi:hypothetical protein